MTPRLAILCYHRLVDDGEIEAAWPYLERGTAVRTETFRAQLGEVTRFADIVSESQAIEVIAGRRTLMRPAVWLTFDDGYREVLGATSFAANGTVFITTCTAERALPADAWYAVLCGARRTQGELDLGLGPFDYDLRHHEGRARLVNGPERRRYLRAEAGAQATALRALAEQLGAPLESPRCYLNNDELRAVRRAGWSLGSHAVSHLPFDELDRAGVVREARESLGILSTLYGPIRSLALPDGKRPTHPVDVQAVGYECVLGLGNALVEPLAEIQPRFIVPDDVAWIRNNLRPIIEK